MNNITQGIRIFVYGMGGVFFFSAFMYIMMRLLINVFKDKD